MTLRNRLIWLGLAAGALVMAGACSADNDNDDSGPSSSSSSSAGGMGGSGGMTASGGGGASSTNTGGFNPQGSGGNGGSGGIFVDPCDSKCGDTELCEPQSVAIDDNCNGIVDENCGCIAGSIQSCFKGDPSYLNDPGCFPGSQQCSELGQWGPCEGGVHATEMCFEQGTGCHPITTSPFVAVDLKTGTGMFSSDAVTETFTVGCPAGIMPCPTPAVNSYTPLQSGEYSVTYTKTTANGTDQCTFPLFVGAPGLRVELTWDWAPGQGTVDLDLHMHKPGDAAPWGGDSGTAEDCAYDNCTATNLGGGNSPSWFNGAAPPDPVNWFLDPVMEKNTCYYGPKGNGAQWQALGMGCHNPRLDIDNVSCNPTITDPEDNNFCNPENINVDFPPKNTWTRIGVHYYSNNPGVTFNIKPVLKVFCNGKLAAELGPNSFYDPTAPVEFPPADASDRFWLAADVMFKDDQCDDQQCVVKPLYIDPVARTPILTTVDIVKTTVGPAYPPLP